MSTTPVNHLVSFLTRPLMRSHTPATIVSLQLCLHTAFSSTLAQPASLLLSASCPPPPQIQRACLVSGVRWAEWIRLLSGGLDVQLFISESALSVQLGSMPRRSLWVAPADTTARPPSAPSSISKLRSPVLMPAGTAFGARLRATLASARTRRGAALNPTRIPTLLSSESDLDSDSESDSDSDVSDSGSSFTSVSSATSVSSDSRSPICTPASPAKPDVTRYMYQGGVTQVVSGGVMLGAPSPKRAPAMFANRRPSGIPQHAARKTADSWRKSA
ncbi:hypothetical protein DFH09DRAFT_1171487 [Mycena vulgaris]|nr:hypothetical protein DFH09DRAFT_1171487 [Mycena vulgaris]